jgi:hypothetical protein
MADCQIFKKWHIPHVTCMESAKSHYIKISCACTMCVAVFMLCMSIKNFLCVHNVCCCVHVVHVHKKISCACTMCVAACMLCMSIKKFLVRAQCVLLCLCCACTFKNFLCVHNVCCCVHVVHVHKKISCACTYVSSENSILTCFRQDILYPPLGGYRKYLQYYYLACVLATVHHDLYSRELSS